MSTKLIGLHSISGSGHRPDGGSTRHREEVMNRGFTFARALPEVKRTGALAVSLLVGGVALAACGGSSDTGGSGGSSSSSSSGGGTQLALVAYSTPKKAYDALTSAYQQTSQGKGI